MNAFCARKSAYVPHFNMLFSLGQLAVFLHICALTITERMPENPHGFFLLFSSLSGIQWPKCVEFQASVKNTKNIQDFYISFKYLYVFEYTGLESLYLKHPAANQKWAINSESVEKLSFCCVIHLSQKECQQRNITPKKYTRRFVASCNSPMNVIKLRILLSSNQALTYHIRCEVWAHFFEKLSTIFLHFPCSYCSYFK